MSREVVLTHVFVEFIPEDMNAGIIYVSIPYEMVAHKCCCGCGGEVYTPLSPTDWKLIFDGRSISLRPSIGNWNFACQSHYWIERNAVKWDRRWSREEIDAGRADDALVKEQYYTGGDSPVAGGPRAADGERSKAKPKQSLWQSLMKLLSLK